MDAARSSRSLAADPSSVAGSSTFRWKPRTRSASGERASLTYGSSRLATNSKALVQAPGKNAHSANGQRHQCSEGEKRTVSEVVNEQAADRGRDQLRGGACHREHTDVAAGGIARRQDLSDDREIDRGEYAVGRPAEHRENQHRGPGRA